MQAMADDFSAWLGQQETRHDRIDPVRCNALRTALGDEADLTPGAAMPLLHHWLHFWDVRPPTQLGEDGHPARGGFLPPVLLPRRMWAGGRITFHAPLHIGDAVERSSTIRRIEAKDGRSGPLVFVTVEHRLTGPAGLALVEEQDLVYREAATETAALPEPATAPPQCDAHRTIDPDAVLLFRYSALTMNGHRIHYDLPYATGAERYPALVVHGPLQATLLAMLAVELAGRSLRTFTFRGLSPAYCGMPLHVCGERSEEGITLWTQQGAAKAMEASATV